MGRISVEVDIDDIIYDLDESNLEYIAAEIDLKEIRERLSYKITPRKVLYELRKYKIDLVKLRDEILEHFPIEKKGDT